MLGAETILLSDMELSRFILAIFLLLASAHGLGQLFHMCGLPRVIGEIAGGLVLGPTVLGAIFPGAYLWIFASTETIGRLISAFYWFGLLLLMFTSGFEIRTKFEPNDRKIITYVLIGSTIIPFVAGLFFPYVYDFSSYMGEKENLTALKLVLAIAIAITSIPVISKIFIDLDLMGTRFARIVLTVATIHDVILWVALAAATNLVSSTDISLGSVIATLTITLVFFAASTWLMPPVFLWVSSRKGNVFLKSSPYGYLLLICFMFSFIASVLNVNIIFGAFLAGIIVGTLPEVPFESVRSSVKEVSMAFFTPIYFAVVGLKLDIINSFVPGLFLTILLFTSFFQIFATLLSARFSGVRWKSALNLAVAMNTKGGPGITLATVAYDSGIINEPLFVTLVIIAIVTSLFAGIWFRTMKERGTVLLE